MRVVSPGSKATTSSPLCFAIGAGLQQIVDIMLPNLQDINHVFPDDFTCLTTAASCDQVAIARQLLELGVDVDLPTRLHIVAENGCEELVEYY